MRRFSLGLLFGLLISCASLSAQVAAEKSLPPLCKAASIDTTFSFEDGPAAQQTIAIHLHNTEPQGCRLRGELVPSFAAGGQGVRVTTCWLCTADGVEDKVAINRNDAFVLVGQGDAQVTYTWMSVGGDCKKVEWGTFGAEWDSRVSFLFQPFHWKPRICSVLKVSGYEASPADASAASGRTHATLQVSAPPTPVYADEWAKITLELKSPNGSVVPSGRCPELYAVYGAGAETRFEAILPDGYGTLVNEGSTTPSGEYISGYGDELPAEFKGRRRLCEVNGNSTTVTALLPASLEAPVHVVPTPNLSTLRHIMWRAVTASHHEPVFVSADTSFTVLDPKTLPQNMGAEVDGVGVGLSVDRGTFTLGESIPLHLHWENFGATRALAVEECGYPEPEVEVQDASHHVISTLRADSAGCMGHGWGPFAVERGKMKNDSISLRFTGESYMLPMGSTKITGPGVYFLTAIWSPLILVPSEYEPTKLRVGGDYTVGGKYTTARSLPVRVEILPTHP